MKTRTNLFVVFAGMLLAVVFCTPTAQAFLLVDPGFESNPLDTALNVLNNFPTYQGVWGVEMATITGVDGGVTPAQGVKMLNMADDGGGTTQGMQVTDLTTYAGLIDSGSAIINLSALFNANQNLPAAIGGVSMTFFTTSTYASNIPPYPIVNLTLDNNTSTWEPISLTSPVPVGTRWVLSQVFYSDASLHANGAIYPAYVDAAELRLVPEPSTLTLLGIGAFGLLTWNWRRYRKTA